MPARFGGGRKQGPDLSWKDDDIEDPNEHLTRAVSPPSNIPGPTFPPRNNIRTPRPLDAGEKRAVAAQLRFRARCREGPLFTVLDKTMLQGADGKVNKRAGFDPFEGQERFSTQHIKKRRTEPDLGPSGRGDYGYTLRLFPQELWGLLDPKQRLPDWKGLTEDSVAVASLGKKASRKKRKKGLDFEKQDRDMLVNDADKDQADTDDDEDPIRGAAERKRQKKEQSRRDDPTTRSMGQRKGLDAEDEFEADPAENPDDEEADDEPEDSEFEEDEDEDNDYNAEQYFDAGDDEDYEGGGDADGGDY